VKTPSLPALSGGYGLCCGILPRGPSHDEGCLDSKSALKTTPPSTLGTLGGDLAPREESRQLVGSRIGCGRVVFSGGGSDALGRGLIVTVGEFSDV